MAHARFWPHARLDCLDSVAPVRMDSCFLPSGHAISRLEYAGFVASHGVGFLWK